MSEVPEPFPKVTAHTLREKKERREIITMLTAYDYPSAGAVDRAGMDSILVGDSLGMVVLGYDNTLPVTMEEMLHHCRAVSRGAERCLLIGDMPFMSYQASASEAVRNAGRFLQEAGMDAVKLEGGQERVETIRAIVRAGIPVLGHLGLTPQSIHQLGGFKVQGRSALAGKQLLEDALALEEAGCFGIVLESIPDRLAGYVSGQLEVPTIGIGAGPSCDGQVLVLHDVLGLVPRLTPCFTKQYTHLIEEIDQALQEFRREVESEIFPAAEHSFSISDPIWEEFLHLVGDS